jgi:hypothetical protein
LACPSWRETKTDVQPLGDQQRREAVPERVERELAGCLQAGALDGLAEAFADVAVVEAAPERVGEYEVTGRLVAAREPAFAQALGDRWAKMTSRLPASVLSRACSRWRESWRWTRIRPASWSMSAQVRPSASRSAARVGEALEQRPVTSAGVFQ